MKNKFNIGDTVKLSNVYVGNYYFGSSPDYGGMFTDSMRNKMRNKEALIINNTIGGRYQLDIDPDNVYYEDMLVKVVDELASSDYTFNPEVERLTMKLEKDNTMKYIDEALDNDMHIKNPDKFQELVEIYKSKSLDKRLA